MKCGDVCLAHYPFTDASGSKLRPVLIVSAAKFNAREDLVVLPISSKPDRDDQFAVYLEKDSPYFAATGLRYESAIKWTKPLAISKRVITRRLGHLPEPLLTDVRSKLRSMFIG
jgi:mRNA interferase MazF